MDIDTLMEIKGFDQIAGIRMPIIFYNVWAYMTMYISLHTTI